MIQSYAERIKRFALAVDILENDKYKQVLELLGTYLTKTLGIAVFEIIIEEEVENKPGLRTEWWTRKEKHISRRIQDDNGNYVGGQVAFAYVKKVNLWVVAEGKKVLTDETKYVDLWPNNKYDTELPPYEKPIDADIKTSIIIPLRQGKSFFGVLNFESENYLEYCSSAKKELLLIAEAIQIIKPLNDMYKYQQRSTNEAIGYLESQLSTAYYALEKPRLFFACPFDSDPEVLSVILRELEKYQDEITVIDWRNINELGNINNQIIKEIESCTYGVCYFSEKPSESPKFSDNSNVVFEAGMLHALTNSGTTTPDNWLPIREDDSSSAPFDFASERTVLVTRNGKSGLNKDELVTKLEKALKGMLGKKG